MFDKMSAIMPGNEKVEAQEDRTAGIRFGTKADGTAVSTLY